MLIRPTNIGLITEDEYLNVFVRLLGIDYQATQCDPATVVKADAAQIGTPRNGLLARCLSE